MAYASYLTEISWLSLLLLIGIVGSLLALKIKISDVLLLLLFGVILGQFDVISFDQALLTGFAIFALIMIIFDSSSKFKPNQVGALSPYALKLASISSLIVFILMTGVVHLIFHFGYTFNELIVSGIFGGMMSGTSPAAVLSVLKDKKHKIIEILELESVLNTPFMIIIPLILFII